MATPRVIGRSRARRGAVQAIYQWQAEFRERDGMQKVDWGFFDALVEGVIRDADRLDGLLLGHLDRAVSALDPVERAILRLATLELADHPDVPWKVVINEAVELARPFGAEASHRYVNGVLDSLARELRPGEL